MMREVRLYGHLGKRFGRVHHFDVVSPAEAVSALKANFPEFHQYMLANSLPGYHVFLGKQNLGRDDLTLQNEGNDVIRIVPAVTGSKRAGVLQVIAGAVLVAVGAVMTYFSYGTIGPQIMMMGIAMMVGGVAQMLVPKAGPKERPENMPSYLFDGPVNTMSQGQPVPLLFGRLIVGSAVLGSAISTEEIAGAAAPADPGLQPMPPNQPNYDWGTFGAYSDA